MAVNNIPDEQLEEETIENPNLKKSKKELKKEAKK